MPKQTIKENVIENDGKVRINLWVETDIKRAWDEFRKKTGTNLTNLIKTAVHEYIVKNSSSPDIRAVSKRLDEIASTSASVSSERDDRLAQLVRDQEEMKSLMERIASRVNSEHVLDPENNGRVLELLSGGRFDTKAIAKVLVINVAEVIAILDNLKNQGLVAQDGNLRWGAIHV